MAACRRVESWVVECRAAPALLAAVAQLRRGLGVALHPLAVMYWQAKAARSVVASLCLHGRHNYSRSLFIRQDCWRLLRQASWCLLAGCGPLAVKLPIPKFYSSSSSLSGMRKPMGRRFTPVPMHCAQHQRPLARQAAHLRRRQRQQGGPSGAG